MSPLSDIGPGSPLRDWGWLALGLAIAASAILLGPRLGAGIELTSAIAATAVFFVIIFLPMALAAIGLGFTTGVRVLSRGNRVAFWAPVALVSGAGGLVVAALYARLAGSAVDGTAGSVGIGLVAGLALIAFQVGCEELFFRGWVQPLLARRLGAPAAIGLAALLFAGFHILGGARSPLTLLNLMLGGLWFGLLAWRSGGVLAPLAAHIGWNATEQLVLGLDPNPGIGNYGTLVDWDLTGAPLWGGTEEGLNASIAMTIVLIALIVPLAWRRVSEPVARAPRPPDHAPA